MMESFANFCEHYGFGAQLVWDHGARDDGSPRIAAFSMRKADTYLGIILVQEVGHGGFEVFLHCKTHLTDELANAIKNHFCYPAAVLDDDLADR